MTVTRRGRRPARPAPDWDMPGRAPRTACDEVRRDTMRRRGGCRMAAVNRVMLLGRVVTGPRPGTGTAGACVLFCVSTDGAGQDDAGQRHRVRVVGDQAAWCLARLRRGMMVHVEGELMACELGGEACAVVAAWLVQSVEADRRSGAPAPARAGAAERRIGWKQTEAAPAVPTTPAAPAALGTSGTPGRATPPDWPAMTPWPSGPERAGASGDDATAWPMAPWCGTSDAGGALPGRPPRRMH